MCVCTAIMIKEKEVIDLTVEEYMGEVQGRGFSRG